MEAAVGLNEPSLLVEGVKLDLLVCGRPGRVCGVENSPRIVIQVADRRGLAHAQTLLALVQRLVGISPVQINGTVDSLFRSLSMLLVIMRLDKLTGKLEFRFVCEPVSSEFKVKVEEDFLRSVMNRSNVLGTDDGLNWRLSRLSMEADSEDDSGELRLSCF
ncbi:hypothetical protein BpHYR1_053248 [Brachionus plicatilis]|uniref:Uncharacterized protein n=1 Tax=Brachionus plicatilis TaxID=10195 RepID=A0A3M7T0I3_BRAPC|nr:hypothetical protein BpHYR1_053248 [Brachionus plicatilis]